MSIAGTRRPSTKVSDPRIGQGNYEREESERGWGELVYEASKKALSFEIALFRLAEKERSASSKYKTMIGRLIRFRIRELDAIRGLLVAAGKRIDKDFRP